METTNVTEKKTFTTMDKSMLLSAARTVVRNCCLKKDKYVKERDEITTNFEAALEKDIQERMAKMRADGAARLEKKLATLNAKIAEMDAAQKPWEAIIIEKTGFRLEDIFNYEVKTGEGKSHVAVTFKYPTTIVPPVAETPAEPEPECPTHEDAEREADIDEDMPGEFTEVPEEKEPEYDSAGFSTEDGLAEGEPAELSELIEAPAQESEEHEFGNDFDADAEAAASEENPFDEDSLFLG